MATYDVVQAAHNKTLSGSTADTVTFTDTTRGGGDQKLMVSNWDATEKLYVRCDGTTAVAAADGTYVIGPNEWRLVDGARNGLSTKVISISVVGNGNVYSVEARP